MNSEKVFVLFVSGGLYELLKICIVGNNSLKISVLIYMNSEKYV